VGPLGSPGPSRIHAVGLNPGLADRHRGLPSRRDRVDVRWPASSCEGVQARISQSSHPLSRHRLPLWVAPPWIPNITVPRRHASATRRGIHHTYGLIRAEHPRGVRQGQTGSWDVPPPLAP